VYSGKVALPGRMLAVGSTVAVAVYSVDSSAAVVSASMCWVSASEAVADASKIVGAAFALASVVGSSTVT
jgi:hypothetical protein